MTFIRLSLVALFIIGGCINRPRVDPRIESERTEQPEPTWRELAARPLNFAPPTPLALVEIGPPPTGLPPTSESSSRIADKLPGEHDVEDDWCSGPIPGSCSSAALDARGQRLWENRVESDGRVSLSITTEPDGWWRLDSCWRDSQGRILSHQTQVTRVRDGECADWDVVTTKEGYDEHGELVYMVYEPEKFLAHWPEPRRDEEGTYAEIRQIDYEDGRPIRKTGYHASLDFSEVHVTWIHNYA